MLESFATPTAYLGVSPLELSANIVYALSVWLAARNSVHTWWTGVVGCCLFGMLFLSANLYADVTLQVFFVVTSIAGWWNWLRGNRGSSLPVRRSPRMFLALRVALAILVAMLYGWLLHSFTNAYAPFVDSLILTVSVLAQFLMMGRRIEHWLAWFVVNSIAVPLYLSRDLNLTAAFYAVYWVNAMYGYWNWRASLVRT